MNRSEWLPRKFRTAPILVSLVGLATIFTFACLQPKTTGPIVPQSPLQEVAAWNDLIAQGNAQVGQTSRQLNAIGKLSVKDTAAINSWTATIAARGKKITAIIDAANTLDAATASSLMEEFSAISEAGNQLLSSGDLFVSNPQSKAAIAAIITETVATATLAVQGIQALEK